MGTQVKVIGSASVAKSASYTILDTDGYSGINVTTGSVAAIITLPLAANNPGRLITVKKVDAGIGALSLARSGSDTIDGNTSLAFCASGQGNEQVNAFITLQSDGVSRWNILAQKIRVYLFVSGAVSTVAAGNVINFPTVQSDSHTGYSAGRWTVPVGFGGIYHCSIGGQNANASVVYALYINGSLFRRIAVADGTTGDGAGSMSVAVSAGDIIDFRPATVSTGAIQTTAWATISRIY